jgi:hypothetical protein
MANLVVSSAAELSSARGFALPRPRIQLVHGTVPQKYACSTLPAPSATLYRPAIEGLRCHPLPTSSTRTPEVAPTDVVAIEIDLVGAHDAHHSLRSRGIGVAHGCSEECPRRRLPRSRNFRAHHFRGFDSLREKANPPIDLPHPPLCHFYLKL